MAEPPAAIPPLPLRRAAAAPSAAIAALPAAAVAGHPSRGPGSLPSAGVSDDAVVQGTSDDAAVSKASAVALGYWQDDFLQYFVPQSQMARRPPLINRGYWARAAAVTQILDEFTRAGEDEPTINAADQAAAAAAATPTASAAAAIPPSSPFYRPAPSRAPAPFAPASPARVHKQVVSLGAGSDTNYFKLKAAGRAPFRYIEVDFPVAVARKAQTIRRTPSMLQLVSQRNPQQTEEAARAFESCAQAQAADPTLDLPSTDYALVGADLRDLSALEAGLRRAQVDFSLPTLILSECVLIYMSPVDSANVLQWLTGHFIGGALIWTYEQIHPFDAFGTTMRANLDNRGCSLLGYTAYPDLASHRARYLAAGFTHYTGWDMNDIYRYALTPLSEVKRIERLELFDEFEEWNMIQAHYQISVASVDPKPQAALQASDLATPAANAIRWDRLGLLGKVKQASVLEAAMHASQGSVVTSGGRTVLLGGSGVRASAPLQPSAPGASNTAGPAKGSLRKPSNAPTHMPLTGNCSSQPQPPAQRLSMTRRPLRVTLTSSDSAPFSSSVELEYVTFVLHIHPTFSLCFNPTRDVAYLQQHGAADGAHGCVEVQPGQDDANGGSTRTLAHVYYLHDCAEPFVLECSVVGVHVRLEFN